MKAMAQFEVPRSIPTMYAASLIGREHNPKQRQSAKEGSGRGGILGLKSWLAGKMVSGGLTLFLNVSVAMIYRG
jgi:hypothetical protein